MYQVDIKAHSGDAVYDVHWTPDEINNIWNKNASILLGSMMFNELPMQSNNRRQHYKEQQLAQVWWGWFSFFTWTGDKANKQLEGEPGITYTLKTNKFAFINIWKLIHL